MAKVDRSERASKQRPAPTSKSQVKSRFAPSKIQPQSPAMSKPANDGPRSGWATDLVFDVRESKLAVSLRLDADVLRFFRGFGAGYQTRINEVLKAFMHARAGAEIGARAASAKARVANGNSKRAR